MTDREHLMLLVKRAKQFRNTPIVDDDFEAYRNLFDSATQEAEWHLGKPPIGDRQTETLQEELCEAKRKIESLESYLMAARIALLLVANDKNLICGCGDPPYDEGDMCPKCLAMYVAEKIKLGGPE